MKFFSKEKNDGKYERQYVQRHKAKIWRRLASIMLCAVLFSTNIVGFSNAAEAGDVPVFEESEEQTVGEVSMPEEVETVEETSVPEEVESAGEPSVSEGEEPAGEVSVPEEEVKPEVEASVPEGEEPTGEVSVPEEEVKPEVETSVLEEEVKPDAEPSAANEDAGEETVYTLHLTHYFRFTVNGEGRSVRAEETLELTEADFEGGVCALERFAYDVPQLTVTEANALSLNAFDGNREGGARIVYAVNSGWQMVFTAKGENEGTVLREIFQGELSDYEFVPANVVTFTVDYQYSKTGGLYGVSPAAPETIQALAKEENGKYVFEFPIKSKSGFRIVLNPAPLDVYLKVRPPENATPEELQEMLDNGDFNGDITKHEVYAYQEAAGDLAATPDYTKINDTYSNIYSTKYNEAWNEARKLAVAGADGYEAMAVCGDPASEHPGQTDEKHGANELENPRLRITLTEEQLKNALESGRSITVNYRRAATWYKAEHWVPVNLSGLTADEMKNKETVTIDGVEYVLRDSETLQGRVGALTKAVAMTEGDVYEKLSPLPFAQELIKGIVSIGDLSQNGADEAGKPTVVKIYYKAAEAYRVIFDTDYAYIPRRQVQFGDSVDFSEINEPQRKGYIFDGWQYLKKGATPGADGKYSENSYIDVEKDAAAGSYTLKIDEDFFQKAQFKTTDGVPALHLYPKWKPDKTNITVVLWTEDLDGLTDVQAIAEGGNVDGSDYYSDKYRDYDEKVTPNPPILNNSSEPNTNYSNVGSFTMEVATDSSLIKNAGADKELDSSIMNKVTEEFNSDVKDAGSDIDPIDFYNCFGFEVMHETNGTMDYTTTTANADGKTTVYVYFTRKIYTLEFHYYGENNNHQLCVAEGTNGYSFSEGKCYDSDGNLTFHYTENHDTQIQGVSGQNKWYNIGAGETIGTPETITIRAKYGADLRNVWPVARIEESIVRTGNRPVKLISWATTLGKYCKEAMVGGSHAGEATIMGLFTSMNEEIIADSENSEKVHHLVAYWEGNCDISYYRYTHCYEVPGLNINSTDIKKISLYNNSTALKDTLYLVPKDNTAFTKYGFTDLLAVEYDESTGEINYSKYGENNGGGYYAVRGYQTTDKSGKNVTKYYAVGRQIVTISSNAINKQNPSARTHMTKVNNTADHTTEHLDTHGQTWGSAPHQVGSAGDPYDLYFYYDRDRYTITYKVPVNRSSTNETELELGYIELPYGARVTKKDYSFELDYKDTNQQAVGGVHKYRWSYPKKANGDTKDPVPVCPDRNENGNKEWKFKGWGLGPAGVNMLWTSMAAEASGNSEPQAQANDDFPIGSDLLLYAIWENPLCSVTFHLNGGTAATLAVDPDDTITVAVPANTKITEGDAKIPRPFYAGHKMEGWYMADEDGNILDPEKEFDFNSFITDDIHVAAKWTAETIKDYSYKVYFVTDKPAKNDSGKATVYIADNQIVAKGTAGAKEYYVLDSEQSEKQYIPGTTLNLKAKEFSGYIPTETNQSLTLNEENSEYNVIFYYEPFVRGSYIVRYVEAGTEQGADPAVVLQHVIPEKDVQADKAVLTPSVSAVNALKNKSYELVNRNDDGKSYSPVEKYDDLKWLDSEGKLHPWSPDLTDLLEKDADWTITYLVQPVPYTITYKNAANSPAAADTALTALTAAENTPIESADGKNPTLYTVKDTFTLENPTQVYDDTTGKWYQFTHWSLGDKTTPGGEYPTLTVDIGTVGNLTFVANWKQLDNVGSLTVSKTVSGNQGDTQKKFTFTVKLGDTTIEGRYGDMDFHAGEASFKLKHGESMTANALPAGITYTVTESDNAGYKVTSTGETGTIETDKTAVAAFRNHKSGGSHSSKHDSGKTPASSGGPVAVPVTVAPPQTGDNANLALWFILLGVSCMGVLVAFRRKKI